MLSYWERKHFIEYDFIIIGSGIVGLSTAIEIKEHLPESTILVLERGLLPTGASTRNAGFACMGSITELLDTQQYNGDEEIVSLFEQRRKGLQKLRSRLGDDNIAYHTNGSYELISDDGVNELDKVEYLNSLLFPLLKRPAFKISNDLIKRFGFSENYTKALVENTCEGEIDTGKTMRALIKMAYQHDVEIKTGASVVSYEEDNSRVAVHIEDNCRGGVLTVLGKAICICTNAFTKKLLPSSDVIPGRGQVLVTHPIPDLPFKGIFHFDKGYYYFREIDGRILIGGGRNLAFEEETTTEIALNDYLQKELVNRLKNIIIPDIPFTVDMRWSGIMAFGKSKHPVVQQFSPKVFGAFRMGGMGVALGSNVAQQIAELMCQEYIS